MTVIEQQRGVGLPEQGNLVRVRDRFWVVESVIPSRLLPTTGNGDSTTAHNAVRLVPVDDKGSPDPLTVYWELEPGTEIRPQASLPNPADGLDDSETFGAFLDAARWDAVAAADPTAFAGSGSGRCETSIAPAAVGNCAQPSLRTAALRKLAPHFEHRLFLTATPHNGYRNSFESLMETLDPNRFATGFPVSDGDRDAVMVRRLKSHLRELLRATRDAEGRDSSKDCQLVSQRHKTVRASSRPSSSTLHSAILQIDRRSAA